MLSYDGGPRLYIQARNLSIKPAGDAVLVEYYSSGIKSQDVDDWPTLKSLREWAKKSGTNDTFGCYEKAIDERDDQCGICNV